MNRLVSFFKKLQIGRVLTVLIAGVALFLTTACNNPSNLQGARPDNLPVQMGGNNNPHSAGGDGYTNYKMSTDPSVNSKSGSRTSKTQQPKRADLNLVNNQLIAARDIDSNSSDLLYPGSSATDTKSPAIGGGRGQAVRPEPITAEHQRVINRSNPDEKILEKVGQQFEDASEFLKDVGNSAAQQPELQNNPALGK